MFKKYSTLLEKQQESHLRKNYYTLLHFVQISSSSIWKVLSNENLFTFLIVQVRSVSKLMLNFGFGFHRGDLRRLVSSSQHFSYLATTNARGAWPISKDWNIHQCLHKSCVLICVCVCQLFVDSGRYHYLQPDWDGHRVCWNPWDPA